MDTWLGCSSAPFGALSKLYWPRSFWPSPRWLSAPRCRGMFRNRKHDLIHERIHSERMDFSIGLSDYKWFSIEKNPIFWWLFRLLVKLYSLFKIILHFQKTGRLWIKETRKQLGLFNSPGVQRLEYEWHVMSLEAKVWLWIAMSEQIE